MINALLGMSVLPADVTPTTATINRLVYADAPYAKLHMRDGTTEDIPFTMLHARVTKLSEEAQAASERVSEAEIGYPTVFCSNDITILDTPGLNDETGMTDLTMEHAANADAVIFALHALFNFSETETQSVCELLASPNVRHILFTVGFLDLISPEERVRVMDSISKNIVNKTNRHIDEDESLTEQERERRKNIIREAAVLGISAKKALDAFVSGSMEDLNDSAIEPYKKELMRRLTAQQNEWLRQEISTYLQDAVSRFDAAVERAVSALQQRADSATAHLDQAQKNLECYMQQRQSLVNNWKTDMWSGLCRIADPSYSADGDKAQARRYCTKILTEIVYAPAKGMSPYYPPMGSGLLDRLKYQVIKASIDSGRFRVREDPINDKLREGFANAKGCIISNWLPALNEGAWRYAKLQEEIGMLWKNVAEELRSAQKELQPKESEPPQNNAQSSEQAELIKLMSILEKLRNNREHVKVEPVEKLLTQADSDAIDRTAIGDVTIGTVYDVASQGAYQLAGALCDQWEIRLTVLTNKLAKAEELKAAGTKNLQELRAGVKDLEEQKQKLQENAKLIRQMILQ